MKNIITLTCLLLIMNLSATVINIPADQPTIQAGIDEALEGDTVLVQPGEYIESINFNGKNIVVASLFLTTADSSYIESTVLHYSINSPYVVTFENGESNDAVIIGFKLGLFSSLQTKGILCNNSSPQIISNLIAVRGNYGIRCEYNARPIIKNNTFENAARGVQISDSSSPTISNNLFNGLDKAVMIGLGSPIINDNIIIGESTLFSRGIEVWETFDAVICNNKITNVALGITVYYTAQADIINNLITDSRVGIECGGPFINIINNTIVNNSRFGIISPNDNWTHPKIINTIIWGNSPNINVSALASFSNSCIEGGIPPISIDLGGNTSRNPCFIDSIDFNLAVFSPCLDAGTAEVTDLNIPEFDFAGNDRIQDGNGDNTSVIDMGFCESETVINPGYVSGTISLLGGIGSVEDVNVGIGAPVHPDENGDYLITIGTSASPYEVAAWLDGYLLQTIQNVEVNAGEVSENIDLDLEYYQPESFLDFSPDSLFFITQTTQNFTIRNSSLVDVNINALLFSSNSGYFTYSPYDLTFPQHLSPNDSLECTINLEIPTRPVERELIYDYLFVITDVGEFTVPLIWDSDSYDAADENEIKSPEFYLSNYPNPFNPTTKIEFSLSYTSKIEVSIYNLKGQKVKLLTEAEYPVGTHSVIWNGDDTSNTPVSSGMYLYKLKVNGEIEIAKKCLLLK